VRTSGENRFGVLLAIAPPSQVRSLRQTRSGSRQTNRGREPNPLTRSYDSHGPDVRIRGSALHVAERYLQLARDAHTGSSPIAAENYLQHAEHYFRLIAAAQAPQFQAQNGDVRATGDSSPGDLDDDDDLGGLPDRFASPGQERQAFTNQTNVVVRAAPQPYGPRQPLVRRKV
jgi:Domain of unknown function (DUF4167)